MQSLNADVVNINNLRTKYNLHGLDLISMIYCNAFFPLVGQNKSGCYLLVQRTFSGVVNYYVGHTSRSRICDLRMPVSTPTAARSPQNIGFVRAVPCRGTTHVKLIIPRITAIADFEQRWRQRGKTVDCGFKQKPSDETVLNSLVRQSCIKCFWH